MEAIDCRERISLRLATERDSELLFDWVNRPESLAAKLQTDGPISREIHEVWLQRRLADPGTRIWIAQADGRAIGQVRLQMREGALEVDVFVTPETRGRGAGKAMLMAAAGEAQAVWPGIPLIARVRHENAASQRLFESAGYRLAGRRADHLVMKLDSPAVQAAGHSEPEK